MTLVPNGSLGSTVFGTTPEESDLQSGNTPEAEVEVVDQGFAITTTKTIDWVNNQTKVSMILSFFDALYFVTINQFKYVPMFVNDYSKFI